MAWHGLHVVCIRSHQAVLVVECSLSLLLCTLRSHIAYAQRHAQTQRVGKAQPLVGIAEVADVVLVNLVLRSIVGFDAVYSLLEHEEHRVVHLLLSVVCNVVRFGYPGLSILCKRHITVGIGSGKCEERIVDTRDVEHVAILLRCSVELVRTHEVSILR